MKFPERICVIGAGPCGLAACKQLAEHGIDFECLERQDEVGGLWYFGSLHSRVHSSTYMISSKRLTEFAGFRMPREFPHYPHHAQALEYLRRYARHFGLYERIRFGTEVTSVSNENGKWHVRKSDSSESVYSHIVLATGHHSRPRSPSYAVQFTGESLHSADYTDPRPFAAKRVLVIGGGNSGCDIACDLVPHAREVTLSLRRGYHFLPKYLFGAPLDRCGETMSRWPMPRAMRRWVASWLIRVAMGPPERYGLPRPEHSLFTSHPIVNSMLPQLVAHDRIQIRPDVDRFEERTVRFADGSEQVIDSVIFATGYELAFPLMDPGLLNFRSGAPQFFLNAFHPQRDDLFVVGMFQPNGGIWSLADLQAQLIARYLRAFKTAPGAVRWFQQQKRTGLRTADRAASFLATDRHRIEVEYFAFRRELQSWLRRFGRRGG